MRYSKFLTLPIIASVLAASCASGSVIAGPGDLGHIHDLVVADGELLVASHSGLYRIDDVNRAVLVGSESHDLMAMAADSGVLLASGHPDLRIAEYQVDGLPPHLGLAQSVNSGETWTVDPELLGKRDFHAIVPTSDGIFAADAQGSIFHRDSTGVWAELGSIDARDLAVSPTSTDQQMAADWDGGVWSSNDGAQSWDPVVDAPDLWEIEWAENGLILGASENGSIWEATTQQGSWLKVVSALPEVETFHVDGAQWWITLHGGSIQTTTDRGETWTTVYEPPQEQ